MTRPDTLEDALRTGLADLSRADQPPAGMSDRLIAAVAPRPPASRPRARWLLPLAAAVVVLALAATVAVLTQDSPRTTETGGPVFGPSHSNGPVLADVPTGAATTACALFAPASLPSASGPSKERPTITPNPDAVAAVWVRGIRGPSCRAVHITRGDAALARRLVADIAIVPAWGPSPHFCPNDTGTAVALYFTHAGQAHAQLLTVTLTGCAAVSAPGRAALLTGTVVSDLLPITPPGF